MLIYKNSEWACSIEALNKGIETHNREALKDKTAKF